MLHTKSQGHRPSGSGEEDYKRVFTIYGHGGHLGHVTRNIWTNFRSPILRSLHMKFEFNWPCGFRGEDVWKCWRTDDGRRSHWYTNSSPRSLRLRWAKNIFKLCIIIVHTLKMCTCDAGLVTIKVNRVANLCVQFVSFMPILSKLYRCFGYGQNIYVVWTQSWVICYFYSWTKSILQVSTFP